MNPPQGTAPEPAWTASDLADPHARADKPLRVQKMFAAIARSYDLNNRLHSLWRDQAWRRFAVRKAHIRPGEKVLDVACGTGDLSQAFARAGADVTGVDFTREMLDLALAKKARLRADVAGRLRYQWGDAQNLEFPDSSFDVVSIAFGIRNVLEPARALAEFARVLKPGGRVLVLEFDTPRLAPVRWFNSFYSGWVMPRTASWIARDTSGAYRYLPRSVSTFMPRAQFLDALAGAGFAQTRAWSLSLGICACYFGVRKA